MTGELSTAINRTPGTSTAWRMARVAAPSEQPRSYTELSAAHSDAPQDRSFAARGHNPEPSARSCPETRTTRSSKRNRAQKKGYPQTGCLFHSRCCCPRACASG
jgi:hypothetical protein